MMSALSDLQARYDGPIPRAERRAALSGRVSRTLTRAQAAQDRFVIARLRLRDVIRDLRTHPHPPGYARIVIGEAWQGYRAAQKGAMVAALLLILTPAQADTLVIDTPIDATSAQALASSGADRIVLNSPGGFFFAALAMAQLVKQRGLTTSVAFAGRCASVCVLVYQAGARRLAHPTASFFYHAVSSGRPGQARADAAWTKLLKDNLAAYGASPALVARMGVGPFLIDGREALAYGVVTEIDHRLTAE